MPHGPMKIDNTGLVHQLHWTSPPVAIQREGFSIQHTASTVAAQTRPSATGEAAGQQGAQRLWVM